MPYHTWRSADYPQDYRPVSPTSQGLGCLRYYQEYLAWRSSECDSPWTYPDTWTTGRDTQTTHLPQDPRGTVRGSCNRAQIDIEVPDVQSMFCIHRDRLHFGKPE